MGEGSVFSGSQEWETDPVFIVSGKDSAEEHVAREELWQGGVGQSSDRRPGLAQGGHLSSQGTEVHMPS